MFTIISPIDPPRLPSHVSPLTSAVCAECGAPTAPGLNFCWHCAQHVCQYCGIVLSNQRQCEKCGQLHGATRDGKTCLDCQRKIQTLEKEDRRSQRIVTRTVRDPRGRPRLHIYAC